MRPKVRGSEKLITSSRKISNQLVQVVGFSNGCAELALKKPPPLVPSSLMASWLATGPAGDGLLAAGQRVDDLVVQVEVLDGAAGDQDDRRDHRDRQQDSERAADQVDPEVAQLTGRRGRSRDQGDRHGHADRGGDEVLHRQPGHLDEVALVDSPEYACQLVLVTKLTAVFQASAGVIGVPGSLRCSGSLPWTSWKTNRNRID